MSERRAYTRLPIRMVAHGHYRDGEDELQTGMMITRDVSPGGAYFYSQVLLPMATELRLFIEIGRLAIKAVGKVVRTDAMGVAVSFFHAELAVS